MRRTAKEEPVYMISIAAQLVGMHPQTLRMYERKGLIQPARLGHMRLYTRQDIERLRKIQEFTRRQRVNLAGVELALKLLEEIEALRREMEARTAELEEELRQLDGRIWKRRRAASQ